MRVAITVAEWKTATIDHLDETQSRVIPFLYDPIDDPFPVIQVSVNGKPPLPFVVDTGTAAGLLLDPWAAEALGLKTSPLTQKGDGYLYRTAPVEGLVFQGRDRKNDVSFKFNPDSTQSAVVDLSFFTGLFPEPRIAGIVGRAALESVTTRFDFAAKTLTVFAYLAPPAASAGRGRRAALT